MVSLLLPVILLIITGWILAHFKLIDAEVVETGLNQILFIAALPAIIFLSIATMPLQVASAIKYVVAYTIVLIATFILSYYLSIKRFQLSKLEANFASLAASVSNAALIGLPILIGIFGLRATVPVALTLIVFILIILPLFTLTIEYLLHRDTHTLYGTLIKAGKKTFKNPLVIAAIAGVSFKILHIHLPTSFATYFQYLADSTVPCSLIIIGICLKKVKFQNDYLTIATISVLNLAVKPFLALLCALWLKLDTFYAISLLVACSVPTSKTLYVISKQYEIFENGTAGIIFLTSIFSLISFPFFLILAKHIWPY